MDDYFKGYSYLEDLDFSFSVRKHYRLAVVADARYHHVPSAGGRISQYKFGQIEVAKRLSFVRKHALSVPRCYVGIVIRLLLTLAEFARHGKVSAPHRAWKNVIASARTFARKSRHGHAAGDHSAGR